MEELLEEFPRAENHMDEVDDGIQAFEVKYCTPPNMDDLRGIVASVHADHEDCRCGHCEAL